MNLFCRLLGHRMRHTERGIAGPAHCARCGYTRPGVEWPTPPPAPVADHTPAERWALSCWTYGDEIEEAGTPRFAWHAWVQIGYRLAGAAHYAELVGDVLEAEILRDAGIQALARGWVCAQACPDFN